MKCFLSIFVLVSWTSVRSQTGPGGVGTSANNVLWLSADNDVYNNAGTTLASITDNVQQWNDRSGNGKNATQSVTANRPNYITNVVNSLPIVRYGGGSDNLISASVTTANVASVWAVASYSTLPSPNPGILIGSPASTGTTAGVSAKCIGMWVSSGTGTQVWGRGIQSNGTNRDISQTTTLNSSTFYIINNIYRAATSINQFVNGAAAGSNNSHNGTLNSWTDITIGRQGTESWNGDIAEIIFYDIEVNTAQKLIIDNYLAAKYGLSLSSGDIYNKDNAANGNYDFEVAGIGRVDASNIHSSAQGSGIVRITNPGGLGNDEFLLWGHNNGSIQATEFTNVPPGVQARMVREWRVSEVSSGSTAVDVGSVDIQFDLAGLGSVTASDLRLLVDTDDDGSYIDETAIAGASLVSGTIYQFTGVTAITNNVRFSLGTISKSQTPLPVELIYFDLRPTENEKVELNWATATEKNSAYFEIERSLDTENWEMIVSVKAAGNSTTLKEYNCVDEHPLNMLSYYKLRQIDLDGKSRSFTLKAFDPWNLGGYRVMVYPNPCPDILTIEGHSHELAHLKVMDATGRSINVRSISRAINNNKVQLDLSSWQPGVYFIMSPSKTVKIIR